MKSIIQLSVLTAIGVLSNAQNVPALPPQILEANLPAQKLGADDLISVTIYDRQELTRAVRIAVDGKIQLPLLTEPIQAAGLLPAELEGVIAKRLAEEEILVRPVVTVSVVEYRSRPVSVVGAVRHPLTFQATSGKLRLLDALAQAEGLTPEAGTEILITRGDGAGELVRRIPVKSLIDNADPEANIPLTGGEQIRVPEAGKVFVVGNVHKPGAIALHDGEALTVLKVLALSEGLWPYAAKLAYIYSQEANGQRNELEVPLSRIVDRKSPDLALSDHDIFYIPDNKGRRMALTTLDRIAAFGSAAGAAAIYGGVR
jgi:polysaccharide export outer membrane protein